MNVWKSSDYQKCKRSITLCCTHEDHSCHWSGNYSLAVTAEASVQSQLVVKVALRDVYPVLSSHHVIYEPADSREAYLVINLLYAV